MTSIAPNPATGGRAMAARRMRRARDACRAPPHAIRA
jgi:hypothetical protein